MIRSYHKNCSHIGGYFLDNTILPIITLYNIIHIIIICGSTQELEDTPTTPACKVEVDQSI